ncbi:hypothetical protein K7X08_025537 [Anisodus acutangulus]|uniref:Uncharacterized protein n=1 Tax=Anisodus acutangulus TaxID=402998 RepID=A0A9Q1R7S1_9SOLA|nr:hypothetical protein K7X08_025537 [Anisodus acutangulus]
MDRRMLCQIVALLLLSIFSQTTIAGPPEGKGKQVKAVTEDSGYVVLDPLPGRLPMCDGYGALCYDPRFVGGDGVMFYFHCAKETDFAIVSDDNLHINAHLIGTRPQGRKRDYTWVQTLSVMFDTHTLVLRAKKVSHWDEKVDALIMQWNGETVDVPTDGDAEWNSGEISGG